MTTADGRTFLHQQLDKLKIENGFLLHRKYYISASRAWQLTSARSDEKLFKYFFESPWTTESMRYGREMEATALEEKSLSHQCGEVFDSGLIICKNFPCSVPHLMVMLDGELLVHVLGIKCLTSDHKLLLNVPHVKDGQLKETHAYYAQFNCKCHL